MIATRCRASPGPPVSRPSVNVAGTVATPVAVARRELDLPDDELVRVAVRPPLSLRNGRVAAASAGLPPAVQRAVDAILAQLLPLYVRNALYRGLVETVASEHGARRTAMKNATDNAGEILEVLKRTYNRQRQASITQEIAEIVGGAAALQG